MSEALAPYRVVELGGAVAAAYCGKLFADFGARVTKVEPPDGDSLRVTDSFFSGWLDTNKHSVVADVADPACAHAVQALVATADVLIDARPWREFDGRLLNHEALRRAYPGLVIVAISWFGETGPYRDFSAVDGACWSWAGLAKLVGPREGPPTLLPGYPAQIVGGTSAFNAAMAGLLGRAEGGRRFSLSIHEANVALAEYQVALGATGMPTGRLGINRFAPTYPLGIFECAQGWLGITIVTPAQWRSFCELFGMNAAARKPDYQSNLLRVRDADVLEPQFASQLKARTAEQWFEAGRRLRLPFVIVPTMAGLLEQDVHRKREAFVPVTTNGNRFQAPALPQRLTATPARRGGQAPALGRPLPPSAAPATAATSACGGVASPGDWPLSGIRILDLSMGWAGPLVTRHLADLGAEVIKVEACQYPDWWRGTDFGESAMAQSLYEKRPPFLMMNRNKKGITLDLTDERGAAMLRELVQQVDAVVENYSQGVLPKLGLDWPMLSQCNPRLVMVSMPAFGSSSEWRDVRAYGSTLEQASGLPTLVGQADWPPTSAHLALGDPVGGLNATSALLIGLDHQRRTGRGQYIDISQVECMLPLAAHALVEQSATGRLTPRQGNRHPRHTPHGVFRCAGEDEWVFIAAESDVNWQALCGAMSLEQLANDARLDSAAGRRAAQDQIEAAIASWTKARTASEAVTWLQSHGVCAAHVVSPFELPQDRHLRERGFWQTVERPVAGSQQPQPSLPFRQSARPYAVRTAAPTLGRDNRAVLGELLHLGEEAICELQDAGVIGDMAVPAHLRRAQAAQA